MQRKRLIIDSRRRRSRLNDKRCACCKQVISRTDSQSLHSDCHMVSIFICGVVNILQVLLPDGTWHCKLKVVHLQSLGNLGSQEEEEKPLEPILDLQTAPKFKLRTLSDEVKDGLLKAYLENAERDNTIPNYSFSHLEEHFRDTMAIPTHCVSCGRTKASEAFSHSYKCSRCRLVYYCSEYCQTHDSSKEHKESCSIDYAQLKDTLPHGTIIVKAKTNYYKYVIFIRKEKCLKEGSSP